MGKQIGNFTKSTVDPFGLYTTKDTTKTVTAPATAAMPNPDGEAVAAARRRKLAEMQARGGRQSTILGEQDLLGG
jgi:hypothetical protein